MDEAEARKVLEREMSRAAALSRAQLVERIGEPMRVEVITLEGRGYQVRIDAFWDAREGGLLRVRGTVDDGGLRALLPLWQDFLVDRAGNVV